LVQEQRSSGQIEKNVQNSRRHAESVPLARRLWQPTPDFPDLAALNDWLEQRCVALWGEIPHAALPGSVADIWAAERAALMPLSAQAPSILRLSAASDFARSDARSGSRAMARRS
jgi:hypothetical protein